MLKEAGELDLNVATLGGEIAEANIIDALSRTYPKAKVRHIYASTEAGAAFSVTDGLPGFPVSYLRGGLKGVELRIGDGGTLLIRSASLCAGYLGDDLPIEEGFVDTGDLVQVVNDRCRFLGRRNGAINVGGAKVQPEHVERVLMQVPGVRMASVTGRKSSMAGNLVEASIVTDAALDDEKALIVMLRKHCEDRLERHMVPRFFRIVDEVKTSAAGKLLRHG